MIMAMLITLIEFVKLVEYDISQNFGFLRFFRYFRIFKSSFVKSRLGGEPSPIGRYSSHLLEVSSGWGF